MLLIILLAAFIVIPLVEIALFIEIGGWIGLWPTIATVVATALLGSFALRAQGTALFQQLQRSNVIALPDLVSNGVLLIVAGACLITPGFLTDGVGLLLLLPPVRSLITRSIMRNAVTYVATPSARASRADDDARSEQPKPHMSDFTEATDQRAHRASSKRTSTRPGASPWSSAPPTRNTDVEDARIVDEDPPRH